MLNGFHRGRLGLCLVLALSAELAQANAPDSTWTRTYNAQGLVESIDGPRTDVNDVTHYTYDSQGRLATVTDALGYVTTYANYDSFGNPGQITDPNGVVTTITYTPQEWPAATTRDSTGTPSTTTLTYDEVGDLTRTQDADGIVLNYTYDDARRLTDITDGAGNRIHYTLDAAGNRTKEETFDHSNTLTHTLSRTFTSLSQLLTLADALGHTLLSYSYPDGYDAAGHPTHSADALGAQHTQDYDALGRLISSVDDASGTNAATQNNMTAYSYDASDNLVGVSDPNGLATTYDHDGLGNPTSQTSPDTGTTTRSFDAAGNVLTQTDAKGVVTTYTYDALNRLTAVSYPDSTQNVTYHYDEANSVTGCSSSSPLGRLTRVVEGTGGTAYCYDARGNVVRKRQTYAGHTDNTYYAYSSADRLIRLQYPSGGHLVYTRDGDGRIASIALQPFGQAAVNVVTEVSYLPFGPISSYTLGNGQTVTRSYDANYALTDVVSPALALHFARDAMGNITALGGTPGASPATETYTYDPLYRLTGVQDASGTSLEAYTYNHTGDRLSKTGGLYAAGTYGYAANTHHLTSIGNTTRTVDADGNTTASEVGGEAYAFGYNDRNRLRTLQRSGATVGTYTYNALGQRVAKTATLPSAISQHFVYDEASHLLGESGTASRDYVWLDDLPVAIADSGSTATVNYVHADGLGTPRAVSDASGTTVWAWPYAGNPFGEQPPTSAGGYTLNLRYPGQYFDAESGFAYNVNRDYEAATGRFLQSDPMGISGGQWGTYADVNGNMLNYIDPLGLCNSQINCDTVLPDGSTVGSHIVAISDRINNTANSSPMSSTPYGPSPSPNIQNPISVAIEVYSGTNFRGMYGGPNANYSLLGDAGNFAYFAISSNIGIPLWTAELAAGGYSILNHPTRDWVGPFAMDPSATRTVSGYGAQCH